MKAHVANIVLLLLILISLGCDTGIKNLDWKKSVSKQKLQIGDTIKVHGVVHSISNSKYEYDTNNKKSYYQKVPWGSTITLTMFSKEYSFEDDNFKANAPIGVVKCKITNPSYNEVLNNLNEQYPEKYDLGDKPTKHEFEMVGTISGFSKYDLTSNEVNLPDILTTAVLLNVETLKLIKSENIPRPHK